MLFLGIKRHFIKVIIGSGSLAFGVVHCLRENNETCENSAESRWDFNWDRRKQMSQNEKQVVRHLIFIRHGQCNVNEPEDKKRILTELGRSQAEMTGKRIKALNFPVDGIITSSMLRAQQTGEIIANCLPTNVQRTECSLLNEGAPIKPDPLLYWNFEDNAVFEDEARIEAAFRKYFYRADNAQKSDTYTIVVCHANVIRYLVCRALQITPLAWLRFTLHHGSITWFSIRSTGEVTVQMLGEAGHIDAESLSIFNYR